MLNSATQRGSPLIVMLVISIFLAGGMSMAENIDPDDHDSQYAWAENVGWINTEPQGDGGPGVQVDDFELTGWMWGENIGWISLSCKNDSTCGTTEYGVINDGNGVLSGYAWGENVGWINFSPSTAGVFIGVASGEFRGQAWGENVGWISFASTETNPFAVLTSWNCDPAPAPPSGSVACTVSKSGTDAVLSWDGLADATGYGIVKGNLGSCDLLTGILASPQKNACPATARRHRFPIRLSLLQVKASGTWCVERTVAGREPIVPRLM